ncbi:MAG: sulfurtransferase [Bacteroidota bacterium]
MSYTTIITVKELQNLSSDQVVIFDCRHSLADTEAGRNAYLAGHIPGARFAHLDEDLSGDILPGITGRHPLPHPAVFGTWLGKQGVSNDHQVVVYDDKGGAIAARLWWMLCWVGHRKVAVLEGGWPTWEKTGQISTTLPGISPHEFTVDLHDEMIAEVEDVQTSTGRIIDARAAARFRGEVEPIDPVAGHIPNADNLPFADNLLADGRFKSKEELRKRFAAATSVETPLIVYCGSGVTACHNLLAMEIAGLQGGRLYPGSWSHWITDPERPVVHEFEL